jgi:hypothetical protein
MERKEKKFWLIRVARPGIAISYVNYAGWHLIGTKKAYLDCNSTQSEFLFKLV